MSEKLQVALLMAANVVETAALDNLLGGTLQQCGIPVVMLPAFAGFCATLRAQNPQLFSRINLFNFTRVYAFSPYPYPRPFDLRTESMA